MNSFSRHYRFIRMASLAGFLLTGSHSYAQPQSPEAADKAIDKLYHSLGNNSTTMAERLDEISAGFLGVPYVLGALGEGPEGRFDRSPLYRTDGFDCETFVDTVLALAFGQNRASFQQCIKNIRYHQGKVDFLTRNHFMSLDWDGHNQQQGYIKDITQTFRNKDNQPVALMATALINKPSWYQHLTLSHIKLPGASEAERTAALEKLQAEGSQLPKTEARIPYIPFTALFDKNGHPDTRLIAQIPDASIVEIVRPNWDLEKKIGTRLNVSHLGFAFWKGETLIFRQASSQLDKVIDIPLIEYLEQIRSSPTIKGINVQAILPQKPLGKNCRVY